MPLKDLLEKEIFSFGFEMHITLTAPYNVNLLFKYLQGVALVKPCTVNLSLETCKELFS